MATGDTLQMIAPPLQASRQATKCFKEGADVENLRVAMGYTRCFSFNCKISECFVFSGDPISKAGDGNLYLWCIQVAINKTGFMTGKFNIDVVLTLVDFTIGS